MISIIIPTLNAGGRIRALVDHLRAQTMRPSEIIVVDSESNDASMSTALSLGCQVYSVRRNKFDHGGVRNFAARRSSGEILVYLTQDVLPVGADFLACLTAPIREGRAAASYARQIAGPDASPTEVFLRSYNYPRESSLRHISGVRQRTLKTFFFSNAASAIARSPFEEVGGFPTPVRTNEDMLLCAKLLDRGYGVAYAAEAEVIHSHNLTALQTFRRYFRIGAMAREQQAILRSAQNSSDGVDFVRRQIAFLWRIGRGDAIPGALLEAAIKAAGFACGRLAASRAVPQPAEAVRSTSAG